MNHSIQPVFYFFCLLSALCLFSTSAVAQDKDKDYDDHDDGSIPEGYTEYESGRISQTSFDQRRRFHLGVYDQMSRDSSEGSPSLEHSLTIDVGGVYDYYDPETNHRHRHRFLEGRLTLANLEIDALLYRYDFSRSTPGAPIWITTFVGEPRRFDIPIEIGLGGSIGQLHYRRTTQGDLMLLDLASGRINWEFYQGETLENYVLLSTGAGLGLRHMEGMGATEAYVFPEAGLQAAWNIGDRGLTQIGVDAKLRWARDVATSETLMMGSAGISAERILIAINDQPISLYFEPHARLNQVEFSGLDGVDLRVMAGIRLSLFVPVRHTYAASPEEQTQ